MKSWRCSIFGRSSSIVSPEAAYESQSATARCYASVLLHPATGLLLLYCIHLQFWMLVTALTDLSQSLVNFWRASSPVTRVWCSVVVIALNPVRLWSRYYVSWNRIRQCRPMSSSLTLRWWMNDFIKMMKEDIRRNFHENNCGNDWSDVIVGWADQTRPKPSSPVGSQPNLT